MNREEAIEEIKQVKFNLNCQLNGTSRFEEAFDMAIKALEQQTCEDAVSRSQVLDIFADNADAVRPYSKTWEEVKALPSVNPQPKWIPVSERLPEESTAVLVWCPERKNIYCACYEEKQWWIFGSYFQKITLEVIAWMPLPEPYESQERNE